MKENTKKTMSLIYKIVLLLLAAVFTYFSVMPAMTIDSNRLGVPSDYTEGRFTSDAQAPGDIDIGFGTIISAVTNWSD
ncbi:MAG: hypothetical protein IJX13_06115, partial [Clostridia bacterium]|nr:hypothetical protein [Clostridia bacterium]